MAKAKWLIERAKYMTNKAIENLATVLSRSISNTMNVEARVQEIEQCMDDFKQWAHSVLGEEYEEISIDLSISSENCQEQIEESFEQLRVSFENVKNNFEELRDIDSFIFVAPKIRKRVAIDSNDGGLQQGLPNYFAVPLPVDEETNEVYQQFLQISLQQSQIAQRYLELINRKIHKSPSHFIVRADDNKEEFLHYEDVYSDTQLLSILSTLKSEGYIAMNTNEKAFIYFFSGRGNTPKEGLNWVATHLCLAVFLKEFYKNDSAIWLKAKNIFGIKNLAKTYNNSAFSCKGEKLEGIFAELHNSIK